MRPLTPYVLLTKTTLPLELLKYGLEYKIIGPCNQEEVLGFR